MLDAVDGAGSMGACEAVVGGVAFGRTGTGWTGAAEVGGERPSIGRCSIGEGVTGCAAPGGPAASGPCPPRHETEGAGIAGHGISPRRFGGAMCEVSGHEHPGNRTEAVEAAASCRAGGAFGADADDGDGAEGDDQAGHGGAFNLYDVYQAIASHDGELRDPIARRGVEIALTKVLGRIEREGRWAVRFADAEGVRRYARKVLATSRRDAARRVAVERRYGRGVGAASARLECAMGGDREAVSVSERAEIAEWMAARIGADDAEILAAVALEERSYPELAEQWGVREGTLRTRFHRARTRLARPWSGEFGAVRVGRERAVRQPKASGAGEYGM